MPALRQLLSLAYWAEANPGVLSPSAQVLHLALGTLLTCGVAASAWAWRARLWRGGALWLAEALTCAVGLAAVALRLSAAPVWSARLWCALAVALALSWPLAATLLAPSWPALRRGWGDLWAFRPAAMAPALRTILTLPALHALALAAAAHLARWPLWAGPALFLALLAPELLRLFSAPSRGGFHAAEVRDGATSATGFAASGNPAASGLRLLRPSAMAEGAPGEPRAAFPALGLNALLPAYLLAGMELGQRVALRLGWLAAPVPLPLGALLAVLAAYAGAYQVYACWPGERRGLAWALPAAIGGAALAWAAWAYLGLYARGVTAADPYGYVQMAVDLMRHGTLLHRFPLALLAGQLGIDAEPLLHVGYRLPLDAGGWAATVWPAGHSVLLGLAGRLAGERAVYLGTPLLALASIAATAWLGALVCDDLPAPLGWLAGSLAGLIVATSFEQLRWVLVHMADVSAQLFSTLTLALVWRGVGNPLPFPPRGGMGSRRQRPAPGDRAEGGQQRGEPAQFPPAGGTVGGHRRRLWLVAAGLALALAYWARHTQLAMALPALAIIVLTGGRASPTGLAGRGAWPAGRLCDGTIYLGAALLGALPDLAYHAALFGSPLCPESKELALYTLRAIPASSALLVRGWLDARELAWLAPFLLAGAVALWRRNRRAALMVALWLAGLWAVQAPYSSLRLRDLLPALPALALVTGYGIVRALGWAARRRRPVAAFAALAIVALLWLRSVDTAALPWRRNFNNFGYLWPTQRAEFARLQGLLEPGAAVGATLNTGAIDLYGGHEAFLAAAWAPGDLQRFLQALWQAGTPTYLLDDGSDMDQVLAAVRAYARVGPAATLRAVPYYAPDGGSELRDVVVYWVRAE